MNDAGWFCRLTALTLLLMACPQFVRAEGDGDALYNKAIAAQTEKGAPLDLAGAKELLLKAADAGSRLAMSRLGDMYRLPDGGVALDMAEARRWYDKAAAANEPYGLLWSANLGDGTLTPEVKAQRYARAKEIALSLALKNSRAVFVVGMCYVVGQGVQKDVETGIAAAGR
jgi:TPR repeat protein